MFYCELPHRQLKIGSQPLPWHSDRELPHRQLKIKIIVSAFMLMQQTAE